LRLYRVFLNLVRWSHPKLDRRGRAETPIARAKTNTEFTTQQAAGLPDVWRQHVAEESDGYERETK
jgi:hypothetical protein